MCMEEAAGTAPYDRAIAILYSRVVYGGAGTLLQAFEQEIGSDTEQTTVYKHK